MGVRRATALVATIALCATACDSFRKVKRVDVAPAEVERWSAADADQVKKKSPFLKAHMRNGDLFVLSEWTAGDGATVSGRGTRYDPSRNMVASGIFDVPIDSVAVFETNQLETSGAAVTLTVLAVVTAAVAIACITNPKACFGSCPTFYVAGGVRPLAEGFSASIAPSLEATDVDALDVSAVEPGRFDIVMNNEAYETHVVRHVDVLAFPHRQGTRTFAGLDGSFYAASDVQAPVAAFAPEGDCLALLRAADNAERFSLADSSDLSAKETVDVTFANPRAGSLGLLIGSRQTLLSTYLLYQTFAYMGNDAGHWIAEIERGRLGDRGGELIDRLGGIAVSIESAPGTWTEIGNVLEFGPIAIDQHLIAFDASPGWTGRVRLTMTKGAWRVDNTLLATLGSPVTPIRVAPREVLKNGTPDANALASLLDPARSLATLPGDEYTLVYQLPSGPASYDILLESRGYYLEWMRDEWMREENPALLAQLFLDPQTALVRLAPEYKRVEAGMEQVFWRSKYAKP